MNNQQLKALGKLGSTKRGRDLIKAHAGAILSCLVDGGLACRN